MTNAWSVSEERLLAGTPPIVTFQLMQYFMNRYMSGFKCQQFEIIRVTESIDPHRFATMKRQNTFLRKNSVHKSSCEDTIFSRCGISIRATTVSGVKVAQHPQGLTLTPARGGGARWWVGEARSLAIHKVSFAAPAMRAGRIRNIVLR